MRQERLSRSFGTSDDDASITVHGVQSYFVHRLHFISATYSEDVTADVEIVFKSGLGTDYDVTLAIIPISSAPDGYYVPDSPLYLLPDDYIEVTAPAGGSGVFGSVLIYEESV